MRDEIVVLGDDRKGFVHKDRGVAGFDRQVEVYDIALE